MKCSVIIYGNMSKKEDAQKFVKMYKNLQICKNFNIRHRKKNVKNM